MTSEADISGHDSLLLMALGMYVGEPCRICGQLIEWADINDAVWAGYSKGNESRLAHGDCWESRLPRKRWQWPEVVDGMD